MAQKLSPSGGERSVSRRKTRAGSKKRPPLSFKALIRILEVAGMVLKLLKELKDLLVS